jgi:Phage capsid family
MSYELISKALDRLEPQLKQLPELAASQREIADRVFQLEQRGTAQGDGAHDHGPRVGLGRQVVEQFTKNAELFARTKSISLEVKTNPGNFATVLGSHRSIPGSGGPNLSPTLLGTRLRQRPLQGVTTLHYGRKLLANANGAVATVQEQEGALKEEVRPLFEAIAQNSITVAGWCPVSDQGLRSAGELEAIIDQHLTREIMIAIDKVLLSGTAAVGWSFPGLNTIASDYPSAVYTSLADTVVEVASHMRWSGYQPSHVVLNPMSYLGIALAKATDGQYLTGQYMGEIPLVLHGMSVCFSAEISAGRALLIDENFVELGVGDALRIDIGTYGDQFIKNMQTIRAEVGIIPIVRDAGSLREAIPKPL